MGSPAGYLLTVLVGGMALLTALVGWRIHHATRESMLPSAQHGWTRAIGISLMGVIIFVWYYAFLASPLGLFRHDSDRNKKKKRDQDNVVDATSHP